MVRSISYELLYSMKINVGDEMEIAKQRLKTPFRSTIAYIKFSFSLHDKREKTYAELTD